MPKICLPLCGLLLASALVLASPGSAPVYGDELLTNGGFESGTDGWLSIDGDVTAVRAPVHSGAFAGKFEVTTNEQAADIFQWVGVRPSSPYEFSGWVLVEDPRIERLFLRISWFSPQYDLLLSDDSPWVIGTDPAFRLVSTAARTSPSTAAFARLSVTVQAIGGFTAHVDDLSFQGPPPIPATPLPTSPPATPTIPPPPPQPTPPRTATPIVTAPPAPPPPQPTAPPAPPPPPQPTAGPPPPPPPPPPTPTAPVTATPLAEPDVFPSVANGSFEQARTDGSPFAWRKIGGAIERVSAPVRSGSAALALTSSTTSTKWAYQTIAVTSGRWYEATVYATKNDADVAAVFLRMSWYSSIDGSGEALDSSDSVLTLTTNSESFQRLSTGAVQAPPNARTAKVRLMLRPASAAAGTAYYDDVSFASTNAPNPTPVPAPTGGGATPPSGATPRPGAPTPTRTPGDPGSPEEPEVFSLLTNGGFEEAREDGTPYAWRRVGGEFAVTDRVHAEGAQSLEFVSSTGSTKWAYQAVRVDAGAWYEATGWAFSRNSDGLASLRLSWYPAPDASGQALDSADSATSFPPEGGGFYWLATGAVHAPAEARSVRVRLMFRPNGSTDTTVYFDAVSLREVDAPADAYAAAIGGLSNPGRASGRGSSLPGEAAGSRSGSGSAVLGVAASPGTLANVDPVGGAGASPATGGGGFSWPLAAALVLPAAGIAALLGVDYVRSRRAAPNS